MNKCLLLSPIASHLPPFPFQTPRSAGWDGDGIWRLLGAPPYQAGAVFAPPPFWAALPWSESRVILSFPIQISENDVLINPCAPQVRAQLDVTSERLSGFSEVSVSPAHAEHVLRELSGHEDKARVSTHNCTRSLAHVVQKDMLSIFCPLFVQNFYRSSKCWIPVYTIVSRSAAEAEFCIFWLIIKIYSNNCNCFGVFWKDILDLALSLVSEGDRLIENSHYAEDSIRPKCTELRGVCEEISSTLRSKKSLLLRAMELHHALEEVRVWGRLH